MYYGVNDRNSTFVTCDIYIVRRLIDLNILEQEILDESKKRKTII